MKRLTAEFRDEYLIWWLIEAEMGCADKSRSLEPNNPDFDDHWWSYSIINKDRCVEMFCGRILCIYLQHPKISDIVSDATSQIVRLGNGMSAGCTWDEETEDNGWGE